MLFLQTKIIGKKVKGGIGKKQVAQPKSHDSSLSVTVVPWQSWLTPVMRCMLGISVFVSSPCAPAM